MHVVTFIWFKALKETTCWISWHLLLATQLVPTIHSCWQSYHSEQLYSCFYGSFHTWHSHSGNLCLLKYCLLDWCQHSCTFDQYSYCSSCTAVGLCGGTHSLKSHHTHLGTCSFAISARSLFWLIASDGLSSTCTCTVFRTFWLNHNSINMLNSVYGHWQFLWPWLYYTSSWCKKLALWL